MAFPAKTCNLLIVKMCVRKFFHSRRCSCVCSSYWSAKLSFLSLKLYPNTWKSLKQVTQLINYTSRLQSFKFLFSNRVKYFAFGDICWCRAWGNYNVRRWRLTCAQLFNLSYVQCQSALSKTKPKQHKTSFDSEHLSSFSFVSTYCFDKPCRISCWYLMLNFIQLTWVPVSLSQKCSSSFNSMTWNKC